MASLAAVDSNGVSRPVIDEVERFRAVRDDPNAARYPVIPFVLNMGIDQRNAEYIVECMRILLQHEMIAGKTMLFLDRVEISDEAIAVFGQFLRETPCPLRALGLWDDLPPRQVHRLLEALHTNRSVKELRIFNLQQDDDAASRIADLLRHKTDSTVLDLRSCRLSFAQIFPLLRGQPHLKTLMFCICRTNSNGSLLFNDPECTQLFVDNVLLSPPPTLQTLYFHGCVASVHNQPLMAGLHKNTTITRGDYGDILQRNVYLGHVHGMLGTTRTPTPLAAVGAAGNVIVAAPTIPPPCGLWATVMAKVGHGTHGATPVFTI
jgi:hypothetical protein